MTPPEEEQDKKTSRLGMETVLPGVQVGLILLVVPLVTWIFSLQLQPVQLSIDGVKGDVAELRDEFRRMDQRIDDLAGRPPNATVMAHIEAILKRLDRLEQH